MSKVTELVWSLAEPAAAEAGCSIWDVEYVKETGGWYLRVYLDKENGADIGDCERVSRALDPILDELDPIPGSYTFEVSSAGCERELKRPKDFERFMGENVEVRHYQPIDRAKSHIGLLRGYNNGDVTIQVNGEDKTYSKAQVAQVRLRMTI